MSIRHSTAVWNGNLVDGSGTMTVGKDWFTGAFTRASRFADGEGTNPEELLGAAHAGCFSMYLAAILTKSGFTPTSIHTQAEVSIVDGPTIDRITLRTEATVPNIDDATFQAHVARAKKECPVSKALAAVPEVNAIATLT
ncbi:OsmC family peroxiredoxin [Anaerolineae bacterium CFX7]|nr:OsmC family peroxiredoxin [Anaerolineae bacterium CFX7]